MIKKIVLTGGPKSGKTTSHKVLAEEFGNQIILVPEGATMLLDHGFPFPGEDLEWSQDWQDRFEDAVIELQRSLEDTYQLIAHRCGINLMVCDRGLLDGAAYLAGGLEEFCGRYDVQENSALAEYEAVIHLESLATADPEQYNRDRKRGNNKRFEPLGRAQHIEHMTRAVWINHANRTFIKGEKNIGEKIAHVVEVIKTLLD